MHVRASWISKFPGVTPPGPGPPLTWGGRGMGGGGAQGEGRRIFGQPWSAPPFSWVSYAYAHHLPLVIASDFFC